MVNISCEVCKRSFKRKLSQIRYSKKHYCSSECSAKGRRNGRNISCFTCNKVAYKKLKDLNNSINKKFFCSKKCSNKCLGKQQILDKHPNWTGGMSSYKKIIRNSNIKQICKSCGREDLRILCVHHIDKNRKNNKIENLVWLCLNCHFLVHKYKMIVNYL